MNSTLPKDQVKLFAKQYTDFIDRQPMAFQKKYEIKCVLTNIEISSYTDAPSEVGVDDILKCTGLCDMGDGGTISKELVRAVINDFINTAQCWKIPETPIEDIKTVCVGNMIGTIITHDKAGNENYDKIFNAEAPDIDLLEVMKQSMKDKPFIIQVPKNVDSAFINKVSQITNDMALKALKDEDCTSVHIAYIKV